MRRIAIVCLFVIGTILTVAVVGCRDKSYEPHDTDDNASTQYDLVFDKTYSDILGCSLPKSATGVHSHITFVSGPWTGYVVANIPQQDLGTLIQRLNLHEEENLLETWPDVLGCDTEPFKTKHWNLSDANNLTLYYHEDPAEYTRTFMTYFAGKMFFKRETTYYVCGSQEDGQFLYKRKLKSAK